LAMYPLESPPLNDDWPVAVVPFFSIKRRPQLKRVKQLGKKKTMNMGPDGPRNQD
jgi:hypothetical protein